MVSGTPGSQIPNANDSPITFASDRYVDGSSFASEANTVTDDILDGAAEQFFGTGDHAFFEDGDVDTPGLGTCFEVRIGDNFVHKSRQVEWFEAFAERGRVVELSGPHDLIDSNPREVLQQIEAFVASLPQDPELEMRKLGTYPNFVSKLGYVPNFRIRQSAGTATAGTDLLKNLL